MSEEYISRKSVRDAIASLSIERFELSNAYRLYVEALDNVDKKVVKIPAADVEPVKHGKWGEKGSYGISETGIDRLQSARCNKCGKYHTAPLSYYFTDYPYCPNCGAKMDGDENV